VRRRLLPDAAQARQQARAARGRHLRGPLEGGRPRHLQRQAGDHQLPQGRAPAARGPQDLERTKRYLPEDLDIYFDDINDANERVWDMLENFKEVVEGLESTNESVLSHEVNDVLRVLTAASALLLPMTLIASIFGMNVRVPGQDESPASGS
jgi:Mg2+ and Co2+ transporter CorA